MLSKQIQPVRYRDIPHQVFRNSILRSILPVHFAELWSRAGYIYPLISELPPWMQNKFPKLVERIPILPTLTLITTIAMLDSIIGLTPFERIKVSILCQQRRSITSPAWLLKGASLSFYSSLLHTGSFLMMQHYLTPFLYTGRKEDFNAMDAVKVGSVFSGIQSVITYPLLTLRTKVQANLISSNQSKLSHWHIMKQIPITTLYAGWRMRFIRGILMASFDSFWINHIRREN